MASESTAMSGVQLPAGVVPAGARETTQTDLSGSLVQGMTFTFRLPGGASTSIFVPYGELGDKAYVARLIAKRVADIQAVTGTMPGA